MPDSDIDLLALDRCTVTAPAGCGKTHLIAKTLARYSGAKPILVLTHTNAGVVALRWRLTREGVPTKAYRLSTIDGWAMRLISTFPTRAGHNPGILELEHPREDYPSIRVAAARLLKAGHIKDILAASYARVIIDEYQDCSVRQHAIARFAAEAVPTCVLGDPMQAIFDFGGDPLAKWDEHVCSFFPVAGQLTIPWRWVKVGAESLGQWLLLVREKLIDGEPIDLRTAPGSVTWVELDGSADHQRRLGAASAKALTPDGRILIMGDSTDPDSQHRLASQIPGAVAVEAVDLRDLVSFAKTFDLSSSKALTQLTSFAQKVMTNTRASALARRVESLARGTARNPATNLELLALTFFKSPTHPNAVALLLAISGEGGVRKHRPAMLRACVKALQMCDGSPGNTFLDAAARVREQNRLLGRPLPRRAVGSTLLLKGLEAEVGVILDASALNARNLYVAMTRGSRAVVICSSKPILNPRN